MPNFPQYFRIAAVPMKVFLSCKQAFLPTKKKQLMPSIHFMRTLMTLLYNKQGSNQSYKTFCRMLDMLYRLWEIYIKSRLTVIYKLLILDI